MARYAFFGDILIARLELFWNKIDALLPGEVRFFGQEDMKTTLLDLQLLDEIINFRPDFVFIHIGREDIDNHSNPSQIFGRIVSIVNELQSEGVKRIYVGEILSKHCFDDVEYSKTCFTRQAKWIHCCFVYKSFEKQVYFTNFLNH